MQALKEKLLHDTTLIDDKQNVNAESIPSVSNDVSEGEKAIKALLAGPLSVAKCRLLLAANPFPASTHIGPWFITSWAQPRHRAQQTII